MSYILQSIILFFAVIIGGISVFFVPKVNSNTFKYSLVFSGSYLFAITILHILPELYHHYSILVGISIISGFFLQLFLEYFSGGIEHGHIHEASTDNLNSENQNENFSKSSISLFVPLCIHALLDSVMLLNNDHCNHLIGNNFTILIGIILHKLPAAFALVVIIYSINKNKKTTMFYLIIFALASPLGLLFGKYFLKNLTDNILILLRAVAGGSFLSISTTIFFESSPGHSLDKRKIIISLLGVLIAILTEFLH